MVSTALRRKVPVSWVAASAVAVAVAVEAEAAGGP